ncbi:hypothetical protein [Nonomuraea sp. LPB2021202275-12-8]|uniref:hypothetical protein n=1 Tax=Nonomuraea sp. LPB2021202275-12-8 TaxID=3120159 RepID=UPI00300C2313
MTGNSGWFRQFSEHEDVLDESIADPIEGLVLAGGRRGTTAVRSLEMIDWAEFRTEYPQVQGSAAEWLARALGASFEVT